MDRPPIEARTRTLDALAQAPLDLLVVGGGIVGAGVARDAALRGLRVGLVDRHDFAFGTSSRSSRLLHGGIRYLAQGRLGLVRDAHREKGVLRQVAPHLVAPLPFIFPAYKGRGWPLWQLRLGVKLYDLLCAAWGADSSSALPREAVLARIPGLRPLELAGAVRYFDALTQDARLVLDTLHSAANAGAFLANYLRFDQALEQRDGYACQLYDERAACPREIRARRVVNATGPWANSIPSSQVRLRLTKGIHLVLDRLRLPIQEEAVVITEGARLLFVIPWGQRVIVGTTDTDYHGPVAEVRTEPADVQYLLSTANHFFPQAHLAEGDVLSSWAGLRPLIANPQGVPSDLSRSHSITSPRPGWWDVAGGKLTTYRLMAEQTVDRVCRSLGSEFAPCETASRPLLSGAEVNGASGILPPAFARESVEHCCAREWAFHLDDVLVRRTSWAHYHGAGSDQVDQVAGWMADCLGWTSTQRVEEVQRYLRTADWPPRGHKTP